MLCMKDCFLHWPQTKLSEQLEVLISRSGDLYQRRFTLLRRVRLQAVVQTIVDPTLRPGPDISERLHHHCSYPMDTLAEAPAGAEHVLDILAVSWVGSVNNTWTYKVVLCIFRVSLKNIADTDCFDQRYNSLPEGL